MDNRHNRRRFLKAAACGLAGLAAPMAFDAVAKAGGRGPDAEGISVDGEVPVSENAAAVEHSLGGADEGVSNEHASFSAAVEGAQDGDDSAPSGAASDVPSGPGTDNCDVACQEKIKNDALFAGGIFGFVLGYAVS